MILIDSSHRDSLAEVFEELYDPAFLIDPDGGCFVGANPAALRFLGYEPEELAALTPADIHPHEIPRLEAFLQAVCRNSRWSTDDLSCRPKTGALIPAQVRASVVRIEGRKYVLAIFRDRREEELAELGRSLRRLTHDLRNTMVASRVMSDRMREHSDPMVQRSAELITRSVDRAVRMCQSALSAGTATEYQPRRERFTLDELIRELEAAVGPEEIVEAKLEAPGSDGVVLDADYDQVFRILLNLVRNALTAGARTITVEGKREDNGVGIEVSDDGPGIPPDVRESLFSEQRSGSGHKGTGLGLAIAWELAGNHGGEVILQRSDASGTVFRITIPDPDWSSP
ncbi:ATP-binding protein [Halofilum ochraceum]|uniref:ATP-binding protein n=1 Tax=Halofilum ochraceum TaxID=1611323 RepID=UPI0008DA7E60|nr:PAS domain-containing sensor histidine kinase [Halofilum ochraceum]